MVFLCYITFIDILRVQLNKARIVFGWLEDFLKDWTTAVTVVFVMALIVLNVAVRYVREHPESAKILNFFPPIGLTANGALEEILPFGASSVASINSVDIENPNVTVGETVSVDRGALLSAANPISNIIPTREGVLIYKVQRGDTLSRIAASFGISMNTILWANQNLKSGSLRLGEELVVLPVSGVLHEIGEGETLDSIADLYSVSVQRIIAVNPQLASAALSVGRTLVIPDTKPLRAENLSSLTALPNLAGYFSIPTTGWNWGQLHLYNAVDIANACGTPIYAAAEGLVIESRGGWNGGYGNYILIEHPNGTQTRYAHNEKNLVAVGDYVAQGDIIGYIGNTGNTHGPTGCHVHFEVKNARNPFAR